MDGILWQRLEGAIVFGAGIALYLALAPILPWWGALLLFFAPDLSFAAYALGNRVGAWGYNLVHIYGCGAILLAAGALVPSDGLVAVGALFLAHAGMDRLAGYGLKSEEGFAVTHLGRIGRRGGI